MFSISQEARQRFRVFFFPPLSPTTLPTQPEILKMSTAYHLPTFLIPRFPTGGILKQQQPVTPTTVEWRWRKVNVLTSCQVAHLSSLKEGVFCQALSICPTLRLSSWVVTKNASHNLYILERSWHGSSSIAIQTETPQVHAMTLCTIRPWIPLNGEAYGSRAGKKFSVKKIRENQKSHLSVGPGFLFIGRNFHRFWIQFIQTYICI